MSQNSTSRAVRMANGSKRTKYVSKACEPCRQRRAKCDGQKPACSSCIRKAIDCQYSAASDGRKPASRSYVQLLRDRIEMLECILRKHSIDVDSAIAQYQSEHPGPAGTDVHDSNTTSAQFEEVCAVFEGTLSLDESVNFDEDGECHYFGPTSGRLDFQDLQGLSCNSHICQQSSPGNNSDTLARSRAISTQPEPSVLQIGTELQAELIDLYFVWQNPWFPVLNESLFRRDLLKGTGRYFSPLLLNCVLSAGSRFSESPEVRTDRLDPNTAGYQFLKNAESLLHYDLLSPSLVTIQAVAIMIYLYVSRAADAVAWLHQGTAHRLALDMGLNIDATSILGLNHISPEEVDLRRQIYWSLYCTDKLHATYSGRVCTMLEIQGAVKLPFLTIADGNDDLSLRSQRTTALLRAHVTQSQILEKVLLGFYAPQPSHTGSRREPFFNTTLVELKNWLYDLSDDLRLEVRGKPNTFPQVYTLHMTFHTALILLGNGLLASNARSTSLKTGNLDALDKKASCVCYEAATNICVAAKKYRRTFGSFHKSPISATHCLLSAALVLIQVASNETEASVKRAATANVDSCLQCLEELSVSWRIAERIHRNLRLLKAQKLGVQPSEQDTQSSAFAAMPALDTDYFNEASFPDVPADWIGFDPTDTVLLNDAHSFLECYSNNDHILGDFDFAAQLADVGMQDSFLWSNLGMDLPLDPGL